METAPQEWVLCVCECECVNKTFRFRTFLPPTCCIQIDGLEDPVEDHQQKDIGTQTSLVLKVRQQRRQHDRQDDRHPRPPRPADNSRPHNAIRNGVIDYNFLEADAGDDDETLYLRALCWHLQTCCPLYMQEYGVSNTWAINNYNANQLISSWGLYYTHPSFITPTDTLQSSQTCASPA